MVIAAGFSGGAEPRPYGGVAIPCVIYAAVVGGCYQIRRAGVVAPYGGIVADCRLEGGRRALLPGWRDT